MMIMVSIVTGRVVTGGRERMWGLVTVVGLVRTHES